MRCVYINGGYIVWVGFIHFRDGFIFVRGISDYKDGTIKSKWQSYAALAAAAVTKSIILALETDLVWTIIFW